MKYVMMTAEEAQKVLGKDAIVLVSTADLTKADCNVSFEKKRSEDCFDFFKQAETIANLFGEFPQLRVFSKAQVDVVNYRPVGIMNTILYEPCSSGKQFFPEFTTTKLVELYRFWTDTVVKYM